MKKPKAKKLLSLFVAAMMVLSLMPMSFGAVFALETPQSVTDGYFTFNVYSESGYATVTECDPDATGEVVIPSSAGGYPVTVIEEYAFSSCDKVTSVTIPSSVTEIQKSVFPSCSSLTEFKLSGESAKFYVADGVLFEKDTDTLALYPAGKEDKAYSVPSGIKAIGLGAFAYAVHIESVTFPDTLETIGESAFVMAQKLKTVNFGNKLNEIGNAAFGYTAIENLAFPDSLETIGDEAFCMTFDLESVTFGKNIKEIGQNAFFMSNLESVVIPGTVKEIAPVSFEYTPKLTKVTIENGVETIGEGAFAFSGIDSVVIPESVKTIGEGAFDYSANLKAITLAEDNNNFTVTDGVLYDKNVTKIISYPQGSEMTVYKIPDTVTYVRHIAAENLKTLIVPKGTEINGYEFSFQHYFDKYVLNYDTYLDVVEATEKNYMKEVPGFKIYGYKGTSAESFVEVNSSNNDVSFVALDDFTGCVYGDWKVTKESTYDEQGTEERTCLLCGKKETRNLIILHPEDVTVGAFDFEIYTKLGYAAVTNYNSENDTSSDVTIPSEVNGYPVTKLCGNVFANETAVTITIPETITDMEGVPAFSSCYTLKEIKVAEGNERYYAVDGVLFDRKTSTLVAYPVGKTSDSYTVPDGTKVIGEEAFAISLNLKHITLNKGLEKIEQNAFAFSNIESVVIPGTVKEIAPVSFEFTPKLKKVTIENGVETIGEGAFAFSGIDSVVIPESVKTIDEDAFNYAPNLKAITLAEGNNNFTVIDGILYNKDVTEIISYPQAAERTVYKIPDTVTYVRHIAAENLKTLIVPKDTEIGTYKYTFGYHYGKITLTLDNLAEVAEPSTQMSPVPNFTIYGYKGTTAEGYYTRNKDIRDVTFVALDDFTGCVFGDWKVTKEPTIFESGKKVRTCLLCGRTEEAAIDKLHSNVTSDSAYGVSLVYADDSFNGNIALGVNEVSSGSAFAVLDSQKGDKLKKLFDIIPYINGQKAQPTKAVWVKIPLPSDFSAETTNAYYVSENGSLEKLDSFIEDGYIFFEVSHFSYYAIVDDGSSVATPTKCDCMCHKSGFSGFIYKIIRIFWKIFGTNKTCDCGAVHY